MHSRNNGVKLQWSPLENQEFLRDASLADNSSCTGGSIILAYLTTTIHSCVLCCKDHANLPVQL